MADLLEHCGLRLKVFPTPDIFIAFTAGTFLMRSAGCVVNDFADHNFDGASRAHKTARLPRFGFQNRSAAFDCHAVSDGRFMLGTAQPFYLADEPSGLILAITSSLSPNAFPLPQFYLGLAFSFGIPMAFAAVQGQCLQAWLMFTANALWTLAYDTIYAMADKEDDLKIGIKTSAITFGHHDITASMLCHFWFTVLMVVLGIKISATWPYWLVLPITVYWQYQRYAAIRTRDRQLCFKHFGQQPHRLGVVLRIGLPLFLVVLVSKLF